MQLRKMSEDGWRNIGTPTARLVQAKHLKASRDSEEKDRRREEQADIVMGEACRFEAGR